MLGQSGNVKKVILVYEGGVEMEGWVQEITLSQDRMGNVNFRIEGLISSDQFFNSHYLAKKKRSLSSLDVNIVEDPSDNVLDALDEPEEITELKKRIKEFKLK